MLHSAGQGLWLDVNTAHWLRLRPVICYTKRDRISIFIYVFPVSAGRGIRFIAQTCAMSARNVHGKAPVHYVLLRFMMAQI